MDGIAEPHLPVCPGRSCGARQRTLRQVLEYSPQSTIRDCARRPCVFRIFRFCRAVGKTVFLLPAVLFSVGADFFHRSDGWAGCLFVHPGSRSGAKVQRRALFCPAFLNFLIKNNRVSLEGLKTCFTAVFLVVWRSFHTFTKLFRLKKSCRKIWWERQKCLPLHSLSGRTPAGMFRNVGRKEFIESFT